MAAVPVTISGVAYPKDKKNPPMPVTIVGYAFISGLKPDQSPPADQPHPEHPIAIPPDQPPPETPLDQMFTMVLKEAPESGGWGFYPEQGGWLYKPPGAGPKRR